MCIRDRLYLEYCRPHKVLQKKKKEADQANKLSEVGWAFTCLKARALVHKAEHRPILYSYGSDGTPML
eukprot:344126-Prorocentrum_lima.AAC.1